MAIPPDSSDPFRPIRARLRLPPEERHEELVLDSATALQPPPPPPEPEPVFEPASLPLPLDDWPGTTAPAGGGGRRALGALLVLLALGWLGYAAWSAGRALGPAGWLSPALAGWVATIAAPLVLLALLWQIFGRTRRREAERFMEAVRIMQAESRTLEQRLLSVTGQLDGQRRQLGAMSQDIVAVGEASGGRIAALADDLARHSAAIATHGRTLDQAAASARSDLGALLGDLPEAARAAAKLGQQIQAAGGSISATTGTLRRESEALGRAASEAVRTLDERAAALAARQQALGRDTDSVGEKLAALTADSDQSIARLLADVTAALAQTRQGIADQSAAIARLADDSAARIDSVGLGQAQALGQHLDRASEALDRMATRIAAHEVAAQRLVEGLDEGLGSADARLGELETASAERVQRIAAHLARLRSEIDAIGQNAAQHDQRFTLLDERTGAMRRALDEIGALLGGELDAAFGASEARAQALGREVNSARPAVEALRDAASAAHDRLAATQTLIGEQEGAVARLLGIIQAESDAAEQRLAALQAALSASGAESERIAREAGPALLAAMTQVRDASVQAAQRAREALAVVVPETAALLGDATAQALGTAFHQSVDAKLAELDTRTDQALERTRTASEGLTRQMLAMSQHARALDEWIDRTRNAGGDQFARRVSLLLESMNSASIDVGKILSDEMDDKSWQAYLKGDRSIYTRRAARLAASSEMKPIAAHYDSDPEFRQSVDRYVGDFGAMLRRISAEADGGPLAVTLMSSDMGKLYAVLSAALDKRRG